MVHTLKTSFKIQEKVIEVDNPLVFKWTNVFNLIKKQIQDVDDKYIIKLNLVKLTRNKLFFDLVYLEGCKGFIDEPFSPFEDTSVTISDDISCLIIPTGIGASFGGYAGDANPLAKLIASSSKYLLTHPNVVNGAILTDVPDNLIYLEGFLLDQFLLGKVNLVPTRQNKIGVIFDKGISDERLEYEVNVLNALKAFYGCEIIGWTQTDKPLKICPIINDMGFSSGTVENIESVVDKALKLKKTGTTGIAICCAIPDAQLNMDYQSGKGLDPIGGVEVIISRVVSGVTGLVSAHAPVLLSEECVDYKRISPLSASEYIGKTFLPSVISGLRFAPEICNPKSKIKSSKSFCNLSNVILPYNAFGSPGVFFLNDVFKDNKMVLLVRDNKTCLDVNPSLLGMRFNIIDSYKNIVNKKKAKELGISLEVLSRPLEGVLKLPY